MIDSLKIILDNNILILFISVPSILLILYIVGIVNIKLVLIFFTAIVFGKLEVIILLSKYGKNVRFNLSYGDIVDLSISIYFFSPVKVTNSKWRVSLFSHCDYNYVYPYVCIDGIYKYCIPYNEETMHLVGKMEEAPEYYKYWDDWLRNDNLNIKDNDKTYSV